MKLSVAGELSLLEILRKRFIKRPHDVVLGIGDDSAVIRPQNSPMLFTTDMMVEEVHFDLSWTTPFQLGFKLVSVNVSDIYAMCGKPRFLLLNFSASRNASVDFFNRVFDGIEAAMKKYGISLIGGDISSSEKVIVSATVMGYAKRFLRRSGARPGDRIYITGPVGDAACGLALMKSIRKKIPIELGKKIKLPLAWDTAYPLIERHLMPSARDPERVAMAATAMIDISDGLMTDLSRLCSESGVGALVYQDRIPISKELRKASEYLGLSTLALALAGGEDYELLFTAPAGKKIEAFCIGEVIQSGIFVVDERGKKKKASTKGYQHFKI
ncbi:MAG: thiamine-phosphate kinase [Nitrospirota bacterium]|nr:thiamine-phosphate kinase [Nitrospirota bacterium]